MSIETVCELAMDAMLKYILSTTKLELSHVVKCM